MNLINWFKVLPASILFSLQKKRKFVEDKIDARDEVYHTEIPDYTIVAVFRVNTKLMEKVLRIKYEQKYLQK